MKETRATEAKETAMMQKILAALALCSVLAAVSAAAQTASPAGQGCMDAMAKMQA